MTETGTFDALDTTLQHLQLEMTRLDLLLHQLLQRQQLAQVTDGSSGVNFHLSAENVFALLQRPFGNGMPALNEVDDSSYANAVTATERQIGTLLAQADGNEQSRLVKLSQLLDLTRFELDVLLMVLAPTIDLRYQKLYGFMQDDLTRKLPTIDLVLNLLAHSGAERLTTLGALGEQSALFRYKLIERVLENGAVRPNPLTQQLNPDPSIRHWLLLDRYEPRSELKAHVVYEADPLPNAALLAPTVHDALGAEFEQAPLYTFHGRDNLALRTAARLLASELRRPLLQVNLRSAVEDGHDARNILHLALRDALISGAVPYIAHWDACLDDAAPPPDFLEAICDFPGALIVSSLEPWQPRRIERSRRLHWVSFPLPDYRQRLHLLDLFLGAEAAIRLDVANVAGQFSLTTNQLRDLVATARDKAAQENRPISDRDLFSAARDHSNPRLATLARKITPRYRWDDLILPMDQVAILQEIVATVRSRPQVLEGWGVNRLAASAGVTVLFAGPPGTGKTMAAEVIAGELNLDLYKIDLSGMVSKYIGETEKNLEKVFNEAESSNAILFFDEADSIFGKRSEVKDSKDRYANIGVSYLLQRMEEYNGITILATNLRANLDDAFTRRLQFALDIPFPDKDARLRIWQTLFPESIPRVDDLDLAYMAQRFKLSGGNIRNVVVSAAYLAATNGQFVTMEHLLHGTRRELQKMGRLVNEEHMSV